MPLDGPAGTRRARRNTHLDLRSSMPSGELISPRSTYLELLSPGRGLVEAQPGNATGDLSTGRAAIRFVKRGQINRQVPTSWLRVRAHHERLVEWIPKARSGPRPLCPVTATVKVARDRQGRVMRSVAPCPMAL